MELLCPICAAPLRQTDRTFRCAAGHSFDTARQGYIHLLPVQNKRSLNPGDTIPGSRLLCPHCRGPLRRCP